jgi:hypothetical protein
MSYTFGRRITSDCYTNKAQLFEYFLGNIIIYKYNYTFGLEMKDIHQENIDIR